MTIVNRKSTMVLYSESNTVQSHRVRVVLAEKDIPVEIELVDPENKPEDLIHLNPYNSLPTLVDRDLVLYDARVITDYLDERYPHPPFMPTDPVSRARTRVTLYRIEQDWYSLLPGLASADPATVEDASKMLTESLTASAGVFSVKPYFLSDEYSMLDATLAPVLWRLGYFGIELPNPAAPVVAYANRIFARPRFQASLTDEERSLASLSGQVFSEG